jgi:hypothetical protein
VFLRLRELGRWRYREGLPRLPEQAYRECMDNRAEVREFLISRRARVEPKDVGLPPGTNRRVAGLRRSEVATLAGVSV